MKKDPHEMKNLYKNPEYMKIRKDLEAELTRLERLYKVQEKDDKP
jgi:hypothetical protein